jgi:hypothetical protein
MTKPKITAKPGDWMERATELTKDRHLREQVQRIMPALTLIRGHKDVPLYEDVVQEAARLVALLETNPEYEQTANVGGIMVCRGPMQGYSIMVHAADVYVMHMGDLRDADGEGEHKWRKAQEYWAAGEEARREA